MRGFEGLPPKDMHRVVPAATWSAAIAEAVESEKTERLARVIALAELLWDARPKQAFLSTAPDSAARTIEAGLTELGARQVEDVVMRALYGLPV